MNLLEARIDGRTVHADGIRVSLSDGDRRTGDRDVILGFRPEHALVVDRPTHPSGTDEREEGFAGVLEIDEHVGHERLWHLRVGARELLVRPRPGGSAVEGQRVRALVDPAGTRLFDPATGEVL